MWWSTPARHLLGELPARKQNAPKKTGQADACPVFFGGATSDALNEQAIGVRLEHEWLNLQERLMLDLAFNRVLAA